MFTPEEKEKYAKAGFSAAFLNKKHGEPTPKMKYESEHAFKKRSIEAKELHKGTKENSEKQRREVSYKAYQKALEAKKK